MSHNLLLIVLILILHVVLPCTASPGDVQKEGKVTFLRKETDAWEVWTAKADGSDLRRLTSDGVKKGDPLWSPNGTKIAYHRWFGYGQEPMAEIVVITAGGEQVQSIPVFSGHLINTFEDMTWLDNHRIGYYGHINPSIGEYRIVDVNSGKEIGSHIGASFGWSPDKKKLVQSGLIVHFAPAATQNYSVQINGKTVYSLPKDSLKHCIKSGPIWSPDSKHLALIEHHEDTPKNWIVLAVGNKERAVESPTEMKEVRDIEWLQEKTISLREFDLTYLEEYYEDTPKNILIILAEGGKELAWELPTDMKEIQDIEWLDEQTLLLRQFNLTYLEGPMWKFDWTKQQLALLDIETKKSLVTGLLKESAAREHLIQSLGGGDPDWWFVK